MKKLITLLTALLVSLSTQATLLTVELNQDSYQMGDVLTANFIISDIEEDTLGFQKLLATFDFNVAWDNSIIEYVSTSFGNKLNVGAGSDQFSDVLADSLGLSETSYAWWDELLPVQGALSSFILASVDFTVIGNGSGMFNLANVAFGDDFGAVFTDVGSSDNAYVVTSTNPVDVPEPASLMLMFMALILLVRQQKVN
ncbi:MAG: PEP-CTERM sorting domain-containing protein [Colwellia sp.]|nr:PEP-CTERM sorting domain-containing protein [Colwellia sp.]